VATSSLPFLTSLLPTSLLPREQDRELAREEMVVLISHSAILVSAMSLKKSFPVPEV